MCSLWMFRQKKKNSGREMQMVMNDSALEIYLKSIFYPSQKT